MQNDIHDRAGFGRVFIALIVGLAALAAGAWGCYYYGSHLLFAYEQSQQPASPFSLSTLLFHSLWVLGALMLALTGLSLVISALMRRRRNLVPGPTLYLLGLAVVGVGIYFLIYQDLMRGAAAVIIGLIICYWEYAFDIS